MATPYFFSKRTELYVKIHALKTNLPLLRPRLAKRLCAKRLKHL